MTRLFAILPAIAALLIPVAAQADDFSPELRVHLAGVGLSNGDESVRWAADERLSGRVEIGAGALVFPGLTILGEFSNAHSSTWVLENSWNDLTVRTAGVRARYAFDLIPIVRPYVSASVGLAIAHNELDTPSTTLTDNAYGFAWDAAGGIEAQTLGRFSVGFYNDYGYAWRSKFHFDGEPRGGDGPSGSVDLGDIQVRGFQWRLGAFFGARF